MNEPANPSDSEVCFDGKGAVRSIRFGDIYYSNQDGLAETRHIYLNGIDAPNLWLNKEACVVCELGFGTGLNVVALIDLWQKTRKPHQRLMIYSIEAFLMSRQEAKRALAHWPELQEIAKALLDQWPQKRNGRVYCDFPAFGVSLCLILQDVHEAMDSLMGPIDAWFLDGFSAHCNPDMWSPQVLNAIAAASHRGTRLASFSVAGAFRRGLESLGFVCEKRLGFATKRECLKAEFLGSGTVPNDPKPQSPQSIGLIGAGIAGSAIAFHLQQLGLAFDHYCGPDHDHCASGNLAALVAPRFDIGSVPIANFFADAFDYAVRFYQDNAPEALLARGLWHIMPDQTDEALARLSRLADQTCYAKNSLLRFDQGLRPPCQASDGLWIKEALTVAPDMVMRALLGDHPLITDHITKIKIFDDRIGLWCESKGAFAHYDHVIVAVGSGVSLIDGPDFFQSFQTLRGQVDSLKIEVPRFSALQDQAYCLHSGDGLLFGATHQRNDLGLDPRLEDSERNQIGMTRLRPDLVAALAGQSPTPRVSIRSITRDNMPVSGQINPRLSFLGGLGSRGFCLAPILAKALVTEMAFGQKILSASAIKLIAPHRASWRARV